MYGRGCCCRPAVPVTTAIPVNFGGNNAIGTGIIAIAILILIALGVIF
ncbi:MAG: hypothetical protein GX248_09345 [Peptococcaceae bacterium]|jgi:hypothetical protein|nr:hypothetical protein [Peptococcaceae bacterium]